MEKDTAAKISMVKEKPLNFLFPLAAIAKHRKNKISDGPVCSTYPTNKSKIVIKRLTKDTIPKTVYSFFIILMYLWQLMSRHYKNTKLVNQFCSKNTLKKWTRNFFFQVLCTFYRRKNYIHKNMRSLLVNTL